MERLLTSTEHWFYKVSGELVCTLKYLSAFYCTKPHNIERTTRISIQTTTIEKEESLVKYQEGIFVQAFY